MSSLSAPSLPSAHHLLTPHDDPLEVESSGGHQEESKGPTVLVEEEISTADELPPLGSVMVDEDVGDIALQFKKTSVRCFPLFALFWPTKSRTKNAWICAGMIAGMDWRNACVVIGV